VGAVGGIVRDRPAAIHAANGPAGFGYPGGGGGGGNASATVPENGGAGGIPGGGGGGGGATQNGVNAGNGGVGARGEIFIIQYGGAIPAQLVNSQGLVA
jgi:hypothetical protein